MIFEKPFPHLVTHRLFDPEKLRQAVADWPDDGWKSYEGNKRAFSDFSAMPKSIQARISIGMEGSYLESRLSQEFGIPDLIADNTLYGAGLHETLRGGRLGMHVDFNVHPVTKLYRRINAILFLNEDWQPKDGGALHLENSDGGLKVIIPTLGTFVAWETADDRWHGHPVPLECESRKSIAWYFYTAEKPPGFTAKHGTIYR